MKGKITMKEAMAGYFARLLERWQPLGGLPKIPMNELADQILYVGEPDENEIVAWKPLEKTTQHSLRDLEAELGVVLHESVRDYFNSYWFCAIGGKYQGYQLQLQPVLPGIVIKGFLPKLLGYRDAHNGQLNYVPLGTERNGLLIVVSIRDGQVMLEDFERGAFYPLASSLPELISSVQV